MKISGIHIFRSQTEIEQYLVRTFRKKSRCILFRGSTAHSRARAFSDFDVEVYGAQVCKPHYEIVLLKGHPVLLSVYFYHVGEPQGNRTLQGAVAPRAQRIACGLRNSLGRKLPFLKEFSASQTRAPFPNRGFQAAVAHRVFDYRKGRLCTPPQKLKMLWGHYNAAIKPDFSPEYYTPQQKVVRECQLAIDFFFKYLRTKNPAYLSSVQKRIAMR